MGEHNYNLLKITIVIISESNPNRFLNELNVSLTFAWLLSVRSNIYLQKISEYDQEIPQPHTAQTEYTARRQLE